MPGKQRQPLKVYLDLVFSKSKEHFIHLAAVLQMKMRNCETSIYFYSYRNCNYSM